MRFEPAGDRKVGSSILLPAAISLLTVGCSLPTVSDSVPSTPAQVLAIESAHRFADMRGVRLDAVIITTPPTAQYASWAVCDQHVVGFNVDYIEKNWVYEYIPAMAAHEVCHIYLKHNLPCGRAEPVTAELDAEACARELGGRL